MFNLAYGLKRNYLIKMKFYLFINCSESWKHNPNPNFSNSICEITAFVINWIIESAFCQIISLKQIENTHPPFYLGTDRIG